MICPICGFKNSKFSVKCESCKSFLQNPVRVLNLFETLNEIIFTPTRAIHKIIISERKNYSIFLASLFGIALTFDTFYLSKSGERIDNLAFLIFYGVVFGVVAGVLVLLLISAVVRILLTFVEEQIKFKSIFALLSYLTFPISFSIFFLLPAIFAAFGIYYFTESPKPQNFKPLQFYLFTGISLILRLYSLVLIALALKHITGSFIKGLIFTLFTSICVVILLNLLTEFFKFIL